MNRRTFLQLIGAAGLGSSLLLQQCRTKPSYTIRTFNDASQAGHLLRTQITAPKTFQEKTCDVLIVGSGVAGLSAAWHIEQQSSSLHVNILELQELPGGNARGGSNAVSSFPWAAHYMPVPGLHMNELLQFLKRIKVITHWENNLPVYDEQSLCFDNKERLFLHGKWHNGLLPEHALNTKEKEEFKRFFALVYQLKDAKDDEGLFYFDIPLHRSSKQNVWFPLINQSAEVWLKEQNFQSPALLWYLSYCCADDFGSGLHQTSAWALLHYFASRKGQGANVQSDDILTWPEGNQYMISKLIEQLHCTIQTKQMALIVERSKNSWTVFHKHTEKDEWTKTTCSHLVLNLPFHVCKKLLPELQTSHNIELFQCYPWIIANMTLRKPSEKEGTRLSWDNVQYGLSSLGFIYANHQELSTQPDHVVFTYYKACYQQSAQEERATLRSKTEQDLANEIIQEMEKVYPDFSQSLLDITIRKMGHGMIAPQPGLLFSKTLDDFRSPKNNLYFCHTDFCGMSIFEEAFYRGLDTAKNILHA